MVLFSDLGSIHHASVAFSLEHAATLGYVGLYHTCLLACWASLYPIYPFCDLNCEQTETES